MGNIQNKLGDLSWLGEAYADQGWVQVEGEVKSVPVSSPSEVEWEKAKGLLRKSDWSMLPDVPMTVADKKGWIEYRRVLREIRFQMGFPDNVVWPKSPE
tara:strand:- start:350 stop:646 length:297 start_codon:yes stop_codon:yes gene_type:complete